MTNIKFDPTAFVAQYQEALNTSKKNFEAFFQTGSDSVSKSVTDAVSKAQAEVEKAGEQAFKAVDEITKFNKENVDAFVASSNIVAKAAEDLNKLAVANAKASFKASLAAAKEIAGAKSIEAVVDVQSKLVKAQYDKAVAEAQKASDLSKKAAEKAVEPIKGRVEAAVETLSKPLAA